MVQYILIEQSLLVLLICKTFYHCILILHNTIRDHCQSLMDTNFGWMTIEQSHLAFPLELIFYHLPRKHHLKPISFNFDFHLIEPFMHESNHYGDDLKKCYLDEHFEE